MDLWKLHAQKSLIFKKSFLKVRREAAEAFLNQEQLIKFVFSWKKRVSIEQFTHYTTYGPQIDFLAVFPTDQKLGRSIPPRRHIVCQSFVLFLDLPCKPEVAYFELIILANQKIFGLDVPVDDVEVMEVSQTFKELVDEGPDYGYSEPTGGFLKYFQQVVLDVLEDEVDDAFFAKGFFEFYDVVMDSQLEYFDFTHGGFASMLLFIRFFEFFDRHIDFGLDISALEDNSIGSLPYCRENLVFLHQIIDKLGFYYIETYHRISFLQQNLPINHPFPPFDNLSLSKPQHHPRHYYIRSRLIIFFYKQHPMACSKLDDLEDIAANLFDFEQDQPRPVRKERALKKQRKAKATPETIEKEEEIIEEGPQIEKAPGTHSIFVKTFGCSHNISDSEFMVGQLAQYGYTIVESINEADLVLINSCTVVNPSQDAFISMVSKAKKIRKPLVVAGCVPQGDTTIPQLADVSAVGVTQIDRIVQVVEETLKGHKIQLLSKKQLPSLDLPKIRKNKDIEIIAINAGCLGACTYCKTVFARGKLISYQPQAIVNRVRTVAQEGVKEIWLTSEDTGAYGRDIGSNISELLVALCEQLQHHEGVMMRIGMTNPPYMLDQLSSIANFLNHPRVFSFIHIPVQAGHNTVLEKMNREYTVQEFRQVADYFLENVPEVTIATDIICGFAEETDQEFEGSMQLIDHYKFRVVNINHFYLRPGTPAANLKQLPTKVVKARSSRLTDLFRSMDKHGYMVGREERVWINESQTYKGQTYLVGHTKNYTKVTLPYRQELLYKQVIMKITKAFEWHIEGQIIDENPPPLPIDPKYVERMKQEIVAEKEKIKSRKQAKLLKLKEKKDKLIEERLKREDRLSSKTQQKVAEQELKKSCCGGDCSCKKEGSSCQTGCCSSETKIIEQPIIQREESAKTTQPVLSEAPIAKNQSQPIFLVLALICLIAGISLLFLD